MSKLGAGAHLVAVVAAALLMPAAAKGPHVQSPFPALTGPYAVGRAHFDWIDESRADPDNVKGHRELVAWVWYPAVLPPNAEPDEWMPGVWGDLFWSDFVTRYPDAAELGQRQPIHIIRAHSYTDVSMAVAPKKAAVLIFAPGKGDVPLKYANLLEDAASHGYVVVGIVPTYDSGYSVFEDGRVVRDLANALRSQPGVSPQQFEARVAEEMVRGIKLWRDDLVFTLNQLEQLNVVAGGRFKGRLDLDQVGAIGHSQGGAASLQLAKTDARVRAVVDLDGMLSPELAESGLLPKPVLVLNSDMIPPQMMAANPLQNYAAVLRSATPGYHLRLTGSTHYFSADFGMLPFLPPSAKSKALVALVPGGARPLGVGRMGVMPLVGSIDPARALTITKAYVEAFFDQYLRGKDSALLIGASPEYPEISFEKVSP